MKLIIWTAQQLAHRKDSCKREAQKRPVILAHHMVKKLLGRVRHQILYTANYVGVMTDHTNTSDRTLYAVCLNFALKWLSPPAQALVLLLWQLVDSSYLYN